MPDRQPALEIDAVLGPDACLILIRGELDAGGCPDLELALADAEQTEARRIIIDLEELTFIDMQAGCRPCSWPVVAQRPTVAVCR